MKEVHLIVNELIKLVENEIDKTTKEVLVNSERLTYSQVIKIVHQERFRAGEFGNHIIDALIAEINRTAKNQLIGEIADTND